MSIKTHHQTPPRGPGLIHITPALPTVAPLSASAVQRMHSVFGPLVLRPAASADGAAHQAFLDALSEQDRCFRRFGLPPVALRPVTLLAMRTGRKECGQVLGELQLGVDRAGVAAAFAVAVRPELRGRGLGRILMTRVLDDCRAGGVVLVRGAALGTNVRMHGLARACGFQLLRAADGSVELAMLLRPHEVG
jgi:GNAT superfamily N-acetyltransferase